jgi:hypothetical protein
MNSNSAAGVVAVSGPALVVNANATGLGPQAAALGPAQAGQAGSNSLDLSQSGDAITGDAVAGGQVTGIVGEGEHTVSNQNNCLIGCLAFSTPAAVANGNLARLGPGAASLLPAQTSQLGDNDAVISQSASAKTGDAVTGGQVTGIVGGSAHVMNSNACLLCVAFSTPSFAVNGNLAFVGPRTLSFLNAQTQQAGDNTTDVAQDATATTGDAVSGSQVTGYVGDQAGFLEVMNQQASTGDVAFSAPSFSANANAALPGPISLAALFAQSSQSGDNKTVVAQDARGHSGDALAGSQVTGGVGGDISIFGTNSSLGTLSVSGFAVGLNGSVAQGGPIGIAGITGSASQRGDNLTAQDQTVDLSSGDAVSGAQVAGAVASGDVVIQASNDATAAGSLSGFTVGVNAGLALGGPISGGFLSAQSQQGGDNGVKQDQLVNSSTGDALSGAQVAGAVADGDVTIAAQNAARLTGSLSGLASGFNFGSAAAGPAGISVVGTNASQLGDNGVAFDQTVNTATGDSVSGAQVEGAVAGGDVTVLTQNSALLTGALSGLGVGANFGTANAGPTGTVMGGIAGLGLIGGSASQVGDNGVTFDQTVNSVSGDAVSGAEVTGVVADGDVQISASNSAFLVGSASGISIGFNLGLGQGGPVANGLLGASAQQGGNNTVQTNQTVNATTGDAVGGAQVTGAVSNDGDITISTQNSSIASLALTAPAFGANAALSRGGPFALGGLGANASQFGDNRVGYAQEVNATVGDAVSGSEVTGAVGGGDVTIQGSNSSLGAISASFPVVGVNFGAVQGGPVGLAGVSGSASQFGRNDLSADQSVNATTGDAVAGSQITGAVAEGVTTISNQNSSIGALALSGPAIAPNFALALGGPVSAGLLSAQSQQTGDNTLDYAQAALASSGDAVAGAQVTGVVGGTLAPLMLSNSDTLSLGLSGLTAPFNAAGGGLTPTAVSLISARVQTSGDSNLSGSQDLTSNSGDAVSGGQVTGRVAGGGRGAAAPGAGVAGVPGTGNGA